MKVLQVSKFYPPVLGGIETVARDLSDGLVRHGVEVEVLCANTRARHAEDVDAAGVRVTRAARLGMLQSTSMAPTLPWLLRQRRDGADIVHVHMPDPLAALAVYTARPQVPVVLHWHSDVVRQRVARHVYKPLETWLLRRADAVIATSRAYADSSMVLRDWQHKVVVIPIGTPPPKPVTAERVRMTKQRYGGRRIVFSLGRMTYYKGFDVLVDAVRALPPDVVVVVGGGGELLQHYRALATSRGVDGRIRFVGPMSPARAEAHFAAAEVFCLASTVRAEAYGVVVLEAMARGKAVVATDIPGSGLGWLHQHGRTGLAVPVRDPAALAAALNRLLQDEALRRRLGEAGQARWAEHFSTETMCIETLALYRRLGPSLTPGPP